MKEEPQARDACVVSGWVKACLFAFIHHLSLHDASHPDALFCWCKLRSMWWQHSLGRIPKTSKKTTRPSKREPLYALGADFGFLCRPRHFRDVCRTG